MTIDMSGYKEIVNQLNISIVYCGPMWDDGIKSIADMVENRLAIDDISSNAAKTVFSVFVEQATNVLMYSAKKTLIPQEGHEPVLVSTGMIILGTKETSYFIQTENAIRTETVDIIKSRIDHLNTLDKDALKKYHKEVLNKDDDNFESKGAGLGLVQIARKATAPIGYKFTPLENGLTSFTMYVEIGNSAKSRNEMREV